MKIAVIAVTDNGASLAQKLAKLLNDDITIYVKAGHNNISEAREFDSLNLLLSEIYCSFGGLIFIMAAGITVRTIAPYIGDKRTDPAVVSMDDRGCFVISLLSGHIGGANDLAHRISTVCGAQPVITTATDVSSQPAADTLAVKLGLSLAPFSSLKGINAAIANGLDVRFFIDTELPDYQRYIAAAKNLGINLDNLEQICDIQSDAAVLITEKKVALSKPHIYLRKPKLAIGIGCRRGTPVGDILHAVTDACSKVDSSIQDIRIAGSAALKRDEQGLLIFCRRFNIPILFFDNAELEKAIIDNALPVSTFVKNQIGVGNVCEAASLLAGQTRELLLTKTKYRGVTVAIATANLP